jgi:acyl-CoA thioesterase-1
MIRKKHPAAPLARLLLSRSSRLLGLGFVLFICLPLAHGSTTASKNILIVGDSISAAYGMSLEEGWVALLARQLSESHPDYRVVNASISGETSAGAASRLPALLAEHSPSVVVIELGGNDGLRGYPIKQLRRNLEQMVAISREIEARVLLLGMQIPPNYGARYTEQFRATYERISREQAVPLVPFLLDGVATQAELMQGDGIHPTVTAQPLLLSTVWPALRPLLDN